MKLVIFGSTAGTGRELVEQALEQGHDVSAFARTPEKLGDLEYPNLRVIQGDVLDSAAVAAAVAGQEAVLCTIGAGAGRTTLREDATRNILQAMDAAGVAKGKLPPVGDLGDGTILQMLVQWFIDNWQEILQVILSLNWRAYNANRWLVDFLDAKEEE